MKTPPSDVMDMVRDHVNGAFITKIIIKINIFGGFHSNTTGRTRQSKKIITHSEDRTKSTTRNAYTSGSFTGKQYFLKAWRGQ